MPGAMSGKKYAGNIKIIETYPIGQGKMIQIIQVGKKYIALVQTKGFGCLFDRAYARGSFDKGAGANA